MNKQAKDTSQMLFVIEYVCLFEVFFFFFFFAEFFLRVLWHSWFTKTSSIFLRRPANLKRPVTDKFCCLTRLLLIYTLMFLRWNLVSCFYIEIISYGRCFFSNKRGTAWYMYIREHNYQAPGYIVYSSPVTHACRGDMRARAHAKQKTKKRKHTAGLGCSKDG